MPDSTEKLHPCPGNDGHVHSLFCRGCWQDSIRAVEPRMNYLQPLVFFFSKLPFYIVFFEVSPYLCFLVGPEPLLNIGITSLQFSSNHNHPNSTAMFVPPLLTTSKIRNQLKCPSTDKEIQKMWCSHTMEYYLALKKQGTTVWDEPWGHYD